MAATQPKIEIISIHIPKTAGTSFRKILTQIYSPQHILDDRGPKIRSISPDIKVIHGHFKANKYQGKFPQAKRIIWLRHPIERLASHYFFWKALPPDQTSFNDSYHRKNAQSILEFAERPGMQDLMYKSLGGLLLSQFYFIGLQNYFSEDINRLKDKLGWPNFNLVKEKTNTDPEYYERLQEILTDKKMIAQLEFLNQKDMALYKAALSLREKEINKDCNSLEKVSFYDLKLNKTLNQNLVNTQRFKDEPNNLTRSKCTLSMCAILKNEAPNLIEWLEFHKMVGVERFYLYDNESSDYAFELIQPYIQSGEVIWHKWLIHPGQVAAYKHCVETYKAESQWIAFLDLDEFLFPTAQNDLQEILKEFQDDPAVGVNWLLFGSSGHRIKPQGLQIEHFTRRVKNSFGPNKHIKSIVQPEKTLIPQNPHAFTYKDDQLAVTEKKKPMKGPFSPTHSVEKLRINHYYTRSLQEYKQKLVRGRAAIKETRPWNFEKDDYNDVTDLTIQRFVPELKKRVDSFFAKHPIAQILRKYWFLNIELYKKQMESTSLEDIYCGEVISIKRASLNSEKLWGFHIDSPTVSPLQTYTVEVRGWVLGKQSPSVEVEILHQNQSIHKTPINITRADVGKAFKHVSKAEQSGFQTKVSLKWLPLESELSLRVVFEDQSCEFLGTIQYRQIRNYFD